MDKIIVIDSGTVSDIGTYKELLEKGGSFAEFLRNYLLEEEEEGLEDLDPESKLTVQNTVFVKT